MADQDLIPTSERRRWVLKQKRQGKKVQVIAEEAREVFGEERLPSGWDSLYVSKDTKRALRQAGDELAEVAEEYRTIEILRLEKLFENLWPYAQEHEVEVVNDAGEKVTVTRPPDERKIDRLLKIMNDLERLYGVDEAPELPSESDNETNVFVQINQQLINEGQ